jgi:hypothetical protein
VNSSNDIEILLGLTSNSYAVKTFLKSLNPVQYPEQQCSEDDYYSTELDYDDLGLQLTFTDAARFNNRMRQFWGDDGVVLEQIEFFNGTKLDFKKFTGKLPLDLAWGDSQVLAAEKVLISKPISHRSYLRDVYSFEKFDVSLKFADDKLSELSLMATPIALTPAWACESPKIKNLLHLINQPLDQLFTLGAWGKLVQEEFSDFDADDGHTLDLRYACGIEIYLDLVAKDHQTPPLIKGYKFYRDRELQATQWAGQLPHDLTWDTSPSGFEQAAKNDALRSRDDEYDGYKLWQFENFDFHIYYSNWLNRASRITIGRSGFLC